MEHVVHPIPPVFDGRSETLILGSFPSAASRAGSFFYHHPQNRFWRVLAAVLEEDVPGSIEDKTAMIEGSSDASIRSAVPNDLTVITAHAPIRRVFCNGALSGRLYDKFGLPQTGLPAVRLPSTSPANAGWSLPRLIEAWQVIAE